MIDMVMAMMMMLMIDSYSNNNCYDDDDNNRNLYLVMSSTLLAPAVLSLPAAEWRYLHGLYVEYNGLVTTTFVMLDTIMMVVITINIHIVDDYHIG